MEDKKDKLYLLTIVKNGNDFVSIDEINNVWNMIKEKLTKYGTSWTQYFAYELKKNNIIHLHTLCECSWAPWIKSPKGWSINLTKITNNVQRVISYIYKNYEQYYGDWMQLETASKIYTSKIDKIFQE